MKAKYRMLLKYHVCIPISAGALLFGVPYSISLLAQWLYGWPNKPGFRKYTEALKPRRIYCLTVAVLEMVKYLQYERMEASGIITTVHSKGIPVWKGTVMLHYLAIRSIEMWLPFQGNVMEMVQDIADCILWSRETGHTFNIDKATESEEMGIELSKQRDILTSVKGVVGLSGVYHIMNHYQYETWRGVEYVSTMHKAMGGIENFEHYSPTLFVKTLTEDKLAK
ncbi:UNVERIFIED_CONTAM: hypothetical protein FKN15_064123 [Acipenser sinensis]